MDPDVTVAVVAYNSADVIPALLDSLPAALSDLSAETIVVDNGSVDDTRIRVSERDDCRLVLSSNVGYAAGVNLAVASGRGRGPILVLNPDVQLAPGCVAFMAKMLAMPSTGIVAPRVLDGNGELTCSLRREPTLSRALGWALTRRSMFSERISVTEQYDQPQVVDWAMGAVLLIERQCFDVLGGWDPTYFLYSEETDFCLRARDAGWLTRYQPAATATHIAHHSGSGPTLHAMQTVNRVRLYRRRHGQVSSLLYMLVVAATEAYKGALGVEQSRQALSALLRPARRPPELGCASNWLPS